MSLVAVRLLQCVRRKLKRSYPTVRQYDRTDCGPASLLSVLRYHGGDASLVTIRDMSQTGVHGTSMWSLLQAAEALGFQASGARGSYEDLRTASHPCIAHLVLDDGHQHFVVVYRVTGRRILIGDPARGLHWMKRAAFCSQWKSRAVLLLTATERLHRAPRPRWMTWVLGYFRREEAWLIQALFMGSVYAGLGLLTALFVRALIDRFIPAGNPLQIIAIGAGLLVLQVMRGLVGYIRSWLLIELNRRVNTRMTADVLCHLVNLPASFFESRRTGDITSRLNDSVRIHAALLSILGNTAIDLVVVGGTLLILFLLAPVFGWMTLGSIAVILFMLGFTAPRVRDGQFEVKQAHAGVQASYIECIGAIDPIRASNSAPVYGELLGRMYEHMQRLLARLGMMQTRVSTAVDVTAGIVVVLALTVGSLAVVRNTTTLGAMMGAYSLLAGALPAATRIIGAYLQLQEASVVSTRLLDLLQVERERNEGKATFRMLRHVSLRGGGFRLHGGKQLLKNIDLDIPRGRITALCGPSGVGKTTLIKILDRRYPLHEGELFVDGKGADEIELSSYRRHVATLPESVSIVNGTIADNITMGRRLNTLDELSGWIERLGLGQFTSRFPSGIRTIVGDEGQQISSGERQTIGLIRALYDLPDLLLVDEGMNAVDAELARVFIRTLEAYAQSHAVLVVSHQARTLLRADHVYLVEGGVIAEHGAPQDLLARDSAFARLVSADLVVARSTRTRASPRNGAGVGRFQTAW